MMARGFLEKRVKFYPTNQRFERFRKVMTEQEFRCKKLIEKDCSIIIRES
jgi:hypothetical protein